VLEVQLQPVVVVRLKPPLPLLAPMFVLELESEKLHIAVVKLVSLPILVPPVVVATAR